MTYMIAIPIIYQFYNFFISVYFTFAKAIRGVCVLFRNFTPAIFSFEAAFNSLPENWQPNSEAISAISFAVAATLKRWVILFFKLHNKGFRRLCEMVSSWLKIFASYETRVECFSQLAILTQTEKFTSIIPSAPNIL